MLTFWFIVKPKIYEFVPSSAPREGQRGLFTHVNVFSCDGALFLPGLVGFLRPSGEVSLVGGVWVGGERRRVDLGEERMRGAFGEFGWGEEKGRKGRKGIEREEEGGIER